MESGGCCGGSCGACVEVHPSAPGASEKSPCADPCGTACQCDNDSDDGFGDYYGDDHERVMREREMQRVQLSLQKVGFVEGVTQARENAVQEGFDVGLANGSMIGLAFGHLLGQFDLFKLLASGTAGSFHSLVSKANPTSVEPSHHAQLDKFVTEVLELEKAWRMSIEEENEHHHGHEHDLESHSHAEPHMHSREEQDPELSATLRGPWQASYLKLFKRACELCAACHLPAPSLPPGFDRHTPTLE